MNEQSQQALIKIAGAEDVGWGIKIKGQDGQIFNVPKLKKNTQIETVAWQALKNLPGYGMGLEKLLTFVTVPNQQGGQSRYVRNIQEPQVMYGQTQPAYQPATPAPAANRTMAQKIYVKDEETKWKEIGWGKCKTLFLVELMKMGKDLINAEPEAERWADASMRPKNTTTGQISPKPGYYATPTPVDPQYEMGDSAGEEEIKIENIPF